MPVTSTWVRIRAPCLDGTEGEERRGESRVGVALLGAERGAREVVARGTGRSCAAPRPRGPRCRARPPPRSRACRAGAAARASVSATISPPVKWMSSAAVELALEPLPHLGRLGVQPHLGLQALAHVRRSRPPSAGGWRSGSGSCPRSCRTPRGSARLARRARPRLPRAPGSRRATCLRGRRRRRARRCSPGAACPARSVAASRPRRRCPVCVRAVQSSRVKYPSSSIDASATARDGHRSQRHAGRGDGQLADRRLRGGARSRRRRAAGSCGPGTFPSRPG